MAAGVGLSYCDSHESVIAVERIPLGLQLEGFVRGLIFATVFAILPGIASTGVIVGASNLLMRNEAGATISVSAPELAPNHLPSSVIGNVGGSRMFTADLTGMGWAGKVYWKSKNPAIIEIEENTGIARFLSQGRTEVCSTDKVSSSSCIEVESRR